MHFAQLALWEWDASRDEVWMTEEGRKLFDCKPGEHLDYLTLGGRVHPGDPPRARRRSKGCLGPAAASAAGGIYRAKPQEDRVGLTAKQFGEHRSSVHEGAVRGEKSLTAEG